MKCSLHDYDISSILNNKSPRGFYDELTQENKLRLAVEQLSIEHGECISLISELRALLNEHGITDKVMG